MLANNGCGVVVGGRWGCPGGPRHLQLLHPPNYHPHRSQGAVAVHVFGASLHCVPWMLMPLPVTHCQTAWGCATSYNVAASSAFSNSNHKLCCQLQVAALQNTPIACPLPPLPMLHPCALTTHFSSLLAPVGILCHAPAHGTFPHGVYGARAVKWARGMHSQSSTAQASSCSCMGCR